MRSQNFDNFGKAKLVKVNGGFSANSVFYEGPTNRAPFTYFLSGNINLNIKGVYNIPLSFTYSNQDFETNRPFSFNRLSLHPSYKWIATHIGDVNMTFSPYTLNGHQFTGFGADLTPDKPFNVSFMYGRLLKEVAFNEQDSLSIPVYKRRGYGIKAGYKFKKWDVGVIGFKASDEVNSISEGFPATFGITPKDNFVGSVATNMNLLDKLQFHVEVANSVITEDVSAGGERTNTAPLGVFVQSNATTQQFFAYNLDFSYPVASGTVGASYERIDPEYRTLGAYFFNNDLENITVNATQTILKGKVSIAVNGGLQRDDLNNTKDAQLQRIVSAVNLGYTPNDKTSFTGSYSNFQSYTNIKNQFDVINEVTPTDNIDTLDFQQISQNAALGIAHQLKQTKEKTQSLNLNLSLQSAISRQNEQITENGVSNFYNAAGTYNLGFPTRDLSIGASANATLNKIGAQQNVTFGPTLTIGKLFFDKKLRSSFSTSYNQSLAEGEKQSEVINLRGNAGYVYQKRHNINLSLLSQLRNAENLDATADFTATLSYSYAFDNFKVKLPKPNPRDKEEDPSIVKFSYRDQNFEGTKSSLNSELRNLQNSVRFRDIPSFKKEELNILRGLVAEEKENDVYKKKARVFLDQLYSYSDYEKVYRSIVQDVIADLNGQMANMDYQLEQRYVDAVLEVKAHELYNESDPAKPLTGSISSAEAYKKVQNIATTRKQKLAAHRWMQPQIAAYTAQNDLEKADDLMQQFLNNEKDKVYRMYNNAPIVDPIEGYLLGQLIDFYFKASLNKVDPNAIELKYTSKN